MERRVCSVLEWRISCITPHALLDDLFTSLKSSLSLSFAYTRLNFVAFDTFHDQLSRDLDSLIAAEIEAMVYPSSPLPSRILANALSKWNVPASRELGVYDPAGVCAPCVFRGPETQVLVRTVFMDLLEM
jgi:hypothetical protein